MNKSIVWSLLSTFSKGLSTITAMILLARWIEPAVFGKTAIINSFLNFFLLLGQFGIAQALVSLKNLDSDTIDSAFWLSVFTAALLYVGLYFASGPLEHFYPESQISIYLPIVGTGIFFSVGSMVPSALLSKKLRFRALAYQNVLSSFVYLATAVYFVKINKNILALMLPQWASLLTICALSFYQSGYRPRFIFSFKKVSRVFGFSVYSLWSELMNFLSQSCVLFIFPKIWSHHDLGIYSFASSRYSKPADIISMQYTSGLLAVSGELRQDDTAKREIQKRLSYLGLSILGPIYICAMITAPILIPFVFGTAWSESTPLLQSLCIIPLFTGLYWGSNSLMYSVGRPDIGSRIASNRFILIAIGVAVGAYFEASILSMSIWITICESLTYLLYLVSCIWILQIRPRQFIGHLKKPAQVCLVTAVVFWLLMHSSLGANPGLVLGSCLIYFLIYFGKNFKKLKF